MNITKDHWLEEARRLPYPSGPAMAIRRFAVAHFTDGATAPSSVSFWQSPEARGAEAHVVIDRDGTVYQIRPFNQKCDHAGASVWKDPNTEKVYKWLNNCSIGVEFANGGYDDPERDAFDWAKKLPGFQCVILKHKNGGPLRTWEVYPEAQILSGERVFQAIVKRYNLDDLVGHDDIAPERKVDPGPAFPMLRLRQACGFKGLPVR